MRQHLHLFLRTHTQAPLSAHALPPARHIGPLPRLRMCASKLGVTHDIKCRLTLMKTHPGFVCRFSHAPRFRCFSSTLLFLSSCMSLACLTRSSASSFSSCIQRRKHTHAHILSLASLTPYAGPRLSLATDPLAPQGPLLAQGLHDGRLMLRGLDLQPAFMRGSHVSTTCLNWSLQVCMRRGRAHLLALTTFPRSLSKRSTLAL